MHLQEVFHMLRHRYTSQLSTAQVSCSQEQAARMWYVAIHNWERTSRSTKPDSAGKKRRLTEWRKGKYRQQLLKGTGQLA